jgi:hypothetical protein
LTTINALMSQNRDCGCDCSSKPKHKKCKCRSYFYAAKNPFDVGISKHMGDGEYLVLLSGNRHGTTDFDGDQLPDWVGIGERPCRHYRTLTTEELVSLWKDPKKCYDKCMRRTTFRQVHPNGYFNFYTTDGLNRSAMVEIIDTKIEVAITGESTLCMTVKPANNDDGRLVLDGLDPHMFRVNLSVNPVQAPKHHRDGTRGDSNDRANIVMASPPVFNYVGPVDQSHGPTITDSSKMMGPTTTTTTTQSNQQTTAQQQAQQQQQGDGGGKKDKKDKKDKKHKKKHDKCKHLKGKKKKECEKKHKHHHGGGGGGGGGDRGQHEQHNAQKKKTHF